MYAGNAASKASGPLSIAVPGELAGLYEAWKQHGKLPWKRLVRGAENLARRGFEVSPYLLMQMNVTKSGILSDEGLRGVFTSNGELLKLGDICFNKKLADTLRAISKYGVGAFYNGSIGLNLVKDVQKLGGILTLKDMQKYQFRLRKPISQEIMGLQILGMPPPSSGGAAMVLVSKSITLFMISYKRLVHIRNSKMRNKG